MQYSYFLAALYAGAALAIQVTSPTMGTDWKDSDTNTITWTSVAGDPSSLNILLVNEAVNPTISITLASNIPTSKGSYTVSSLTGSGSGYQINLISTTSTQILAQSNQFTLETGGSPSSSSTGTSTSSMSSTTASATTTTLTTTATLSGSTTTGTMTMTGTGTTLATMTMSGTKTGTATGSATAALGSGVTAGSGTATASATGATGSSAAEKNVVGMVGVVVAGLVALMV